MWEASVAPDTNRIFRQVDASMKVEIFDMSIKMLHHRANLMNYRFAEFLTQIDTGDLDPHPRGDRTDIDSAHSLKVCVCPLNVAD